MRQQLDELGARDTKIVVTSDLDEYAIASLAAAPVDAYGVGTQLVTGSGHPTCSMVYKLVARAQSADPDGTARSRWRRSRWAPSPRSAAASGPRGGWTPTVSRRPRSSALGAVPAELVDRQLLVELVKGGEVVAREPLDAARERHIAALAGLPLSAIQLSRGEPVLPTEYR